MCWPALGCASVGGVCGGGGDANGYSHVAVLSLHQLIDQLTAALR